MKETMVDVLLYLFERYMAEELEPDDDRAAIEGRLLEAGFPSREIEQAFDWLEDFSNLETLAQPSRDSTRIYHPRELAKLGREGHGFLVFLEQRGILNPALRELVIERVMALNAAEIGIEQLKWLVLMVLYNLPEEDASAGWLEQFVLDELDFVH
ncbi:MAG TPA: DUF494 domain-containing protein [Thiotrichales bacterium]|nr:DUF494 domain-containing protein [Thiotrichales bacterium]